MSSTEARLSATARVGDWMFTARGENENEFAANVSVIEQYVNAFKSAPTQDVGQVTDPHAQAVQNLNNAGVETTPVAQALEERTDKFGNRFVKGDPSVPSCIHGPRVVAYKTSKAGKPYKAYACVNDSPFGDYKAGKCQQEYPER